MIILSLILMFFIIGFPLIFNSLRYAILERTLSTSLSSDSWLDPMSRRSRYFKHSKPCRLLTPEADRSRYVREFWIEWNARKVLPLLPLGFDRRRWCFRLLEGADGQLLVRVVYFVIPSPQEPISCSLRGIYYAEKSKYWITISQDWIMRQGCGF